MSITCVIWVCMTLFTGAIQQFCCPRYCWRNLPNPRNQGSPKLSLYLHVLQIQYSLLLLRPLQAFSI